MNASTNDRPTRHHIIRMREVCVITGLSRSTLYQLESARQFPRRIKLGMRAVGWLEADIQAWLDKRIYQSQDSLSAA